MSDQSPIEWTEATWNPIAGCSIHSPGCKGCYAMRVAWRLMHNPNPKIAAKFAGTARMTKAGPVFTGMVNLDEETLLAPLRRKKPTVYFVNSLSDLFHVNVPDAWVDRIFDVAERATHHTFQILTKRGDRMRAYLTRRWRLPDHIAELYEGIEAPIFQVFRHIWVGVSVEDQKRADERIPDLLATPAAVRFLSCEPLIGPVDLTRIEIIADSLDARGRLKRCGTRIDGLAGKYRESGMPYIGDWDVFGPYPEGRPSIRLDWVICGGESGPRARPMHPDWARSLRDQCAAAEVPFFFKQWGEWAPQTSSEDTRHLHQWVLPPGVRNIGPKSPSEVGGALMVRVGKKAAGRLLDGVTHAGMPAA